VAFLIVDQLVLTKGMQPGTAVLLGLVGGYLAAQCIPARSRYIPVRTKREVIAEFEANTGEKYNRRKHELDHRWPYSRGGSNTADNLRVVSRARNRRKGAKRPKPADWF
jgi:5-methylcytosine-specific restriction endonuclease McrA